MTAAKGIHLIMVNGQHRLKRKVFRGHKWSGIRQTLKCRAVFLQHLFMRLHDCLGLRGNGRQNQAPAFLGHLEFLTRLEMQFFNQFRRDGSHEARADFA